MPKTFQKKLNKFIPVLIIIWMVPTLLTAQEFNCSVTVNDRQISASSYDHISELPNLLENYINGRRWTNDTFEPHERIVCNIQILLTNVDSNLNFTSEVVFTIRRPVYDTNQQSLTLVLSDSNWRFNFPRGKSLIHDDLQFDDMASFMDYYAYIMLGFDYDSFSELGGTPFFSRAQSVLDLGQNSGVAGWGRSIGAQRNRFGLITDIMNPSFEDLRKSFYRYHRLGLDQFTIDPEIARNHVINSLETIRNAKRVTTSNYLFDIFFSTKYTEIVAIFADADVETRTEAFNILRDVDPAHTSEYQKLQN
jgi:hypothetical protein